MKKAIKTIVLAGAALLSLSGCRLYESGSNKGNKGPDGPAGSNGQDGKDGPSPYDIYVSEHPEYTGDEDQWYEDYANGLLADELDNTDGLIFVITNGGEYVVTDYIGSETNLVIGDFYRGKPIVTIANEALSSKDLVSLKLGKNMRRVADCAFSANYDLASVSFNEGLLVLEEAAFSNCGLTSIALPSTLKYIGLECFYRCPLAGELVLPPVDIVGHKAFGDTDVETVILQDGIKMIEAECFQNDVSLKEITFPGSLESIEESMCKGDYSLEKVTIQSGVKTIKANAFDCAPNGNCDIYIPSSVTEIESVAFTKGSGELNIYCKAPSKPEGWADDWLVGSANVVWGYQG